MGTYQQNISRGEMGYPPPGPIQIESKEDMERIANVINGMKKDLSKVIWGIYKDAKPEDVEDILQETFKNAADQKKLDSFRGESELKTWVTRIAINATHNYLRSLSRHAKESDPKFRLDKTDDQNPEYGNIPDTKTLSIEHRLIKKERDRLINQAIQELPDTYREPLVLYYVHEMSYEDIALNLNVPIGTVRSRIFRAKEALQKKLKAA